MALYPPAVKKLLPLDTKMDPPIKARVVILHVAATNAASLFDYFNGPSGGVESHFYVRTDGSVEQYRDTAYQADANMQANNFAISIESQGLADGTWSDAQLASIKALISWCHTTHGIPLSVPQTWDGSGVGYHILFEDQWDQRHASCPGPNRIKQFQNDIVPWMTAGGVADMPSTIDDAVTILTSGTFPKNPFAATPAPVSAAYVLEKLSALAIDNAKQIAALKAQVASLSAPQQPAIDYDKLATALRDKLADGSTSFILGKA